MTVPKYVQEILSRSKYEFTFHTNHEWYAPGYTIRIKKASAYTYADTFRAEIERLVKWANRVTGVEGLEIAFILDVPSETHHCNQVAVVSIFDPVMQKIEQYIGEGA
jgi:hypothetical protein